MSPHIICMQYYRGWNVLFSYFKGQTRECSVRRTHWTIPNRKLHRWCKHGQSIWELEEKRHKPTLHVLNNECSCTVNWCSCTVKRFLFTIKIYQLPTPITMLSTRPNQPSSPSSATQLPILQQLIKIFQSNFGVNVWHRSKSQSIYYTLGGWIQQK